MSFCMIDAQIRQSKTTIKIDIGGEIFTCSGLVVEEKNYLEVYTFEKWTDKFIPVMK